MSTRHGINDVLPGELLCKIFQLSLDPRYLKRDRCRLSLVCRLWCQWVEDSALLWTNITTSDGLSYFMKSFKKSKDAPLYLTHSDKPNWSAFFVSVERFLQEASPHVARWRSLSIGTSVSPPSWVEALGPLITKSSPKLEALKISTRGSFGWKNSRITITIGDGTFLKLVDVFLTCVPASIHATNRTALRSLVLDQVPHISLHNLVGILENSPHLETLGVMKCRGLKMTNETCSVDPIKLERLADIKLRDLDASVIDIILSIIRTPNCDKLTISCTIPDPPSCMVLFNSSADYLHQPFRRKDQERPLLDVIVEEDEGGEYLWVDDGHININVQVDTNGVAQLHSLLRWMRGHSDPEGSYPVSLAFYCDFPDLGYVEAFGPPFDVKRIKIYEDSQHPILEHLSRPRPLESSAWPCPQLEDLEYNIISGVGSRDRTYLLDMLRARYGQEGVAEGSGKPLRTPLKSITLCSKIRPDELIRDIKEFLRNLEIKWNPR